MTLPARREVAAALLASGWVLPIAFLAGVLSGPDPFARPDVLAARVLFLGFVPAVVVPANGVWVVTLIAIVVEMLGSVGGPGPARLALVTAWVTLALVPAQLFARWTRERSQLAMRSLLHVLFHAAILLGVLPAIVARLGGGGWQIASVDSVFVKVFWQIFIVPGVLLLSAVQEFAERGGGTPMPDDAPTALVTSGPYAYVANPMQIGKVGVVALWGGFWSSPGVVACAAAGAVYSLTIARAREDRALGLRFGSDWERYRSQVRRWWPRWRPHWRPDRAPAVLRLEGACAPCRELGAWFNSRLPIGLVVSVLPSPVAAPLAQVTYHPGEGGPEETGTAALARALEHIHLGWAFLGWTIRLPLVSELTQLLADVSGAPSAKVHGLASKEAA